MLKMKDNNYINNIAAIRKKQGISQTQFANAIGVETSTISRIETGKSDPSAVTLFAIANNVTAEGSDFPVSILLIVLVSTPIALANCV